MASDRAPSPRLVEPAPLAALWSARLPRLAAVAVIQLVLLLLAISMVVPYVFMIANSFKTTANFLTDPYGLLPRPLSLEAYLQAFELGSAFVYLRNSVLYATTVLVVQLTIDTLAAFAFARLRFRGRDLIFYALLGEMMLPGTVTLIPSYLIVRALGLANSYPGVVSTGLAGAFGIFLLRQFFLSIPSDLEDAAVIDGANKLQVLHKIIVPLAKPALITLGIFLFSDQWTSFIWPLVVISDQAKYPITVGIALFRDQQWTYWNMVFASSVIASFPLIVVFFFGQRYIIGGISLSGMKG